MRPAPKREQRISYHVDGELNHEDEANNLQANRIRYAGGDNGPWNTRIVQQRGGAIETGARTSSAEVPRGPVLAEDSQWLDIGASVQCGQRRTGSYMGIAAARNCKSGSEAGPAGIGVRSGG
jgi:hypothetical protein